MLWRRPTDSSSDALPEPDSVRDLQDSVVVARALAGDGEAQRELVRRRSEQV